MADKRWAPMVQTVSGPSYAVTTPHIAALWVVGSLSVSSVLSCCLCTLSICWSFGRTATCRRLLASTYPFHHTSSPLLSVWLLHAVSRSSLVLLRLRCSLSVRPLTTGFGCGFVER